MSRYHHQIMLAWKSKKPNIDIAVHFAKSACPTSKNRAVAIMHTKLRRLAIEHMNERLLTELWLPCSYKSGTVRKHNRTILFSS